MRLLTCAAVFWYYQTMPLFAYKVVREDGTSANDDALAADAGDLRRDLEVRGYMVLNSAEKITGLRGGRRNAKDFLIFSQKFIPLVKAGLPIRQSLEIIQKRTGKPGFRTVLDAIKLRIPLVRTLLTQYFISQLTRTFATMLRGCIPFVQSLETTTGVIGNRVIARRLTEARDLVTDGTTVSQTHPHAPGSRRT